MRAQEDLGWVHTGRGEGGKREVLKPTGGTVQPIKRRCGFPWSHGCLRTYIRALMGKESVWGVCN